jgi:hypothetical protein
MADPSSRAGAPSLDLGLPVLDWPPPGFGTSLPWIAEMAAAIDGIGSILPEYPLWKPIAVELPVDPPEPPSEPARPKLDPEEIEWKRQDLILVGQIIDALLNWEREVFFHIRGEVIARTKIRLFDDEAPSPVSTDYPPSQWVSAPVDDETQAYWNERNRQYGQRAEARRAAAAASDPAPSPPPPPEPAAATPNLYLRGPGEPFEAWQRRLFDVFGATQTLIGQQPEAALAQLTQLKAAVEADPKFQRNANAYAQSIDPAFYADPAAWVRAHGLPASALKEIPRDEIATVYPEDADPIAAFIQSNGTPFIKIAGNGKIYDIGDILTSPARGEFLKPPPPIASIYNHASLELAERTADLGDAEIDAATAEPAMGIGQGGGPAPIFVPPRLRSPEEPEPAPPQPKLAAPNAKAAVTDAEVEAYVAGLPRKNTPTVKPSGQFEVEQTGPYNYTVPAGGEKIDIDGYGGTTILDAKFVEKPDISPYIHGSNAPDFLRQEVLKDQQSEFKRLAAAIDDPAVPFTRLEILTNDPRAVPYFQGLINQYKIPGTVRVVPTGVPQKK